MTDKEVLEKLRTLLTDHWYPGDLALNDTDHAVFVNNPAAVRFGLIGGLWRIVNDPERFRVLLKTMERQLPAPYRSVSYFNTNAGHDHVMTFLNVMTEKKGPNAIT